MPKKPRSSKAVPLTFEALSDLHDMVVAVKEDLKSGFDGVEESAAKKIAYGFEWSSLYDTSYRVFLSRLAHLYNVPLEDALAQENAAQNILKWARHDEETIKRIVSKGKAHELATLAATIALFKNIKAMLLWGRSINSLLDMGLKDNGESLSKAVRVDQTAIGTRKANKRIARAVLTEDSVFLGKLSNALKGKLGNSREYLSTARVVVLALHESGQLKKMKVRERSELLVTNLRLISDDPQKDTAENFNRFINRLLSGQFRP